MLSASLDSEGTLRVEGTDSANAIGLARDGADIVVTMDGGAQRFRAADVRRVLLVALGGVDRVTVASDLAGADAAAALPVTVDGGATTTDQLTLTGTAGNDRFDVEPTGATVVPAGGGKGIDVSFAAVERLFADGGAGDDPFFLAETNPGVQAQLLGGAGNDTFTVGDPTRPNTWSINAGVGINGGPDTDVAVYNDQATVGTSLMHNYRLAPFAVSRGPMSFEQAGLERVTLNTGDASDYVEVLLTAGTELFLNAGGSTLLRTPRTERFEDVLWLSDTLNASNTTLTMTGPDSGRFTFHDLTPPFEPVHFTGVEKLAGADITRPTVAAGSFTTTPRQRIELRFSEDVNASLQPADLRVTNVATGEVLPAGSFRFTKPPPSPTQLPNVALWEPLYPLAPGDYRAVLPAGSVQDAARNTMGADYTLDFTSRSRTLRSWAATSSTMTARWTGTCRTSTALMTTQSPPTRSPCCRGRPRRSPTSPATTRGSPA